MGGNVFGSSCVDIGASHSPGNTQSERTSIRAAQHRAIHQPLLSRRGSFHALCAAGTAELFPGGAVLSLRVEVLSEHPICHRLLLVPVSVLQLLCAHAGLLVWPRGVTA